MMQNATDIIITDHAFERGQERLGFNKIAMEMVSKLAYKWGKRRSSCKGELRMYIDEIYFRKQYANNIRIYAGCIFLFRNRALLTVYPLPYRFKNRAA
jgi:hypothetical protein